jgi:hypothetical protein
VETAPPAPPKPLPKPEAQRAAATPEALAAVARASFPEAQPLSVTLVPPPSPYGSVATADLPEPQPLAVTLVPPTSPYAAVAQATFPDPQPLAVTLVPGEVLVAETMLAGIAPPLTLGPARVTVQIVQVIPRRGVNFFDRNNPIGQTTLVATAGMPPAAGGSPPVGAVCVPPAAPPVTGEICGTSFSLSDDGFPFALNGGPQGNRTMHVTPIGGTQIQIAAQTGISPAATCPALLCTATQIFTPGAACDGVSYDDAGTPKAIVVRFRRNGAQVCGQLLDDPF